MPDDKEPPSLPPEEVGALAAVDPTRADEERSFHKAGMTLDRRLRRLAGYGGLATAGVLYLFGVALIALLALCSGIRSQAALDWHIWIASLVALFTVPTVLVLAILRSSSVITKDAQVDSLQAAVGTKVMEWLDQLLDTTVRK